MWGQYPVARLFFDRAHPFPPPLLPLTSAARFVCRGSQDLRFRLTALDSSLVSSSVFFAIWELHCFYVLRSPTETVLIFPSPPLTIARFCIITSPNVRETLSSLSKFPSGLLLAFRRSFISQDGSQDPSGGGVIFSSFLLFFFFLRALGGPSYT